MTDSFSKPPILSERFATTPTYQYYQLVDAGIDVGRLFLSQLCVLGSQGTPVLSACETQLEEVTYADYIDVDFDAISHALTFTAFWSAPRVTANLAAIRRASRSPRKLKSSDRLEVGVLQSESATEPNELSLGGFLTVLGEDDQPSKAKCARPLCKQFPTNHRRIDSVLFSFPSRHHTLPNASFNTIFQRPTGLHPTLEFTLPTQHLHAPDPSCKLHAYLTLPSALFIDRYQFTDALFLRSHNLIALHSLSGETDLEAPDWTIQRWGSAALFELATPFDPFDSTSPDPFPNSDDWTITLPLHLRYLAPDSSDSSSSTSHRNLPIPNPVLFYACPAPLHASPNTNNPFDRLHLGYDGLFTPDTIFHHILPMAGSGQGVLEIDVPVLDVGYASQGTVQAWTGMVVVSGFLWVCWRLFAGARKKEKGGGEGQRRG